MGVNLVQAIAVYAIPVIFAITLHEAAHAYVARHFGDMTAYVLGRVSLNPCRHIDLVGTIVVPLVMLAVSGGGLLFGWAKPVPVNFHALRNPKRDMLWVAAAGPAANLVMALAWATALKLFDVADAAGAQYPFEVAKAGIEVNIVLMAINLLPILPLDGGRILASILPMRVASAFARTEPLGLPILIGLVFLGSAGINVLGMMLDPIMHASMSIIGTIFQL
jgi:Zn-dependent protease